MSFHQASTESTDSTMDSPQITTIKRPTDVPDFGQLCDLLWSDQAKMSKNWQHESGEETFDAI
ncbi:unnamed protein product [Brassica oleracea var. botrytis]|uniref:(rape) hypothetical protein n=1 Tax=Brassica napus TaxID=3708 RepID=A0A816JBF7_BRANA|nr:unnamed protein product [Brassica napus]